MTIMFLQVEKIQKILIFIFFFKCRIFLIQSQATTNARELQNEKERIIRAGSNFTLNCTATRSDPKMDISFEWQYPHENKNVWAGIYHEDSEFEIKMKYHGFKGAMMITPVHNRSVVFERQLKDRNFLSTLQITNASFIDTGFYTCIIRNGTEGNIIQTSEQHVFVHDLEFKFLPPPFTVIYHELPGNISEPNLTFECRPTHPSVHMELFRISDARLMNRQLIASSNNSLIGNGFLSFNPFKGFIFQKPATFNFSGQYECRADSIYKAQFEVEIYGMEIILSTDSEQIPAETSFEITCRSRNKPWLARKNMFDINGEYNSLRWLWIPDEPFNGKTEISLDHITMGPLGSLRKENIDTTSELFEVYNSFLKWQSIPVEASGIYRCWDSIINVDGEQPFPPVSTRLNVSFPLPQRVSALNIEDDGGYRSISKELEKRYHLVEKIYNAGDQFQMECQANVPHLSLEWKEIFRNNIVIKYNVLEDIDTRETITRNSIGHSSSIIRTVVNASYLDTGYYFCLGPEDYRDGTYNLFGSQFIFILDPQQLMLPPLLSRITIGSVVIERNYGVKNIPIGCGPTHPDVQVFLNYRNIINEEIKVVASSLSPNDENSVWTFSTHAGFMLKTVDSWEIEGEFFCSAKWPNETIATRVTQNFTFFVVGTEILPLNGTTIFEGDELILTCKSDYESANVDLSWNRLLDSETEKLGSREDRDARTEDFNVSLRYKRKIMSEDKPTKEGDFLIHRLRFKEFKDEDAGLYECCRDIHNLRFHSKCQYISINVSRLEIPIVDTPKQEINTSQNGQVNLTCTLGNEVVPKAEVQWFVVESDSNPRLIGSSSADYTINPMKDRRTSQLVVHQTVSDAKFKCVFRNRKGNATKEFTVNVKPKIWTDGKIAAIVIAIIVIITIVIIIVRWKVVQSIRKQKLLEGNLERINPDKPIEDQIELLPYDPKHESPINWRI